MPLSHVTKVFGIDDAGIYKVTTDPAGAPPTYGAKVDIVASQSMELTLATDTKELRGDNTLIAADSILKDLTGKVLYGKWNFDVWAALSTATVSDSGITPNQSSQMIFAQTTTPAFAKVEVQSKHVDYIAGDVHYLLYKLIPANLLAGLANEDYKIQEFSFTAVPIIGTISSVANAWFAVTTNETAVAIV